MQGNVFEDVVWEMAAISSKGRWINSAFYPIVVFPNVALDILPYGQLSNDILH